MRRFTVSACFVWRNRKTVLGWFTVSACLWLERNSCLCVFHSLTVSLASHGAFSMLLKTSRSCSNDARRFSDAAAVKTVAACFIRLLSLWRATLKTRLKTRRKQLSLRVSFAYCLSGQPRCIFHAITLLSGARRFSDAAAVTFRSSCSNSRMRRSLASHVSGGTVHSASAKQKDY